MPFRRTKICYFPDWCGICGGNNSTCREERGIYNRTEYGYNTVVRIPAGANNIEILQYGYGRNSKDDTYIALRDVDTGNWINEMFRSFFLSISTKKL
jgi:hypothetical protein